MYSNCQIIADLIKGQSDTGIPDIMLEFDDIVNIFLKIYRDHPSKPIEACIKPVDSFPQPGIDMVLT